MKACFYKSVCALAALAALAVAPCRASAGESASSGGDDSGASWKEIAGQGKKALKEAGKFFSSAGKQLGQDLSEAGKQLDEAVEDSLEAECAGEWIFRGKKTKTELSCGDDGTMRLTQKTGVETLYWQGTYTATAGTIVFSVTESGTERPFSNETVENSAVWVLRYTTGDDGESMMLSSGKIPQTADGTDFSGGVLFKRK